MEINQRTTNQNPNYQATFSEGKNKAMTLDHSPVEKGWRGSSCPAGTGEPPGPDPGDQPSAVPGATAVETRQAQEQRAARLLCGAAREGLCQ
jgi:hypothetical protein